MNQVSLLTTLSSAASVQTAKTVSSSDVSDQKTSFQDALTQKQKKASAQTDQSSVSSGTADGSSTVSNAGVQKQKDQNDQTAVSDASGETGQTGWQDFLQSQQIASVLAAQAAVSAVQTAVPQTAAPVVVSQTAAEIVPAAGSGEQQAVASINSGAAQTVSAAVQSNASIPVQTAQTTAQTASGETKSTANSAESSASTVVSVGQNQNAAAAKQTGQDGSSEENSGNAFAQSGQNAEEDGNDVQVTVTSGAKSLFDQVQSVPVKVGDVVNTQASDMDSQIAQKVTSALDQGMTRVEIQLSPKSLGTVTIEMTQSQDGALHVVLKAAGENTQALLDQHASGLQTLLADRSSYTVSVEVQRQDQQTQQDLDSQSGQQQRQQQQESQRHQQEDDDFLQQLRLNLNGAESETS